LGEFRDVVEDKLPHKLSALREINHQTSFIQRQFGQHTKLRLSQAQKTGLEEDVKERFKAGVIRYSSEITLATSQMVSRKRQLHAGLGP
jgi:hypothetical protein